MAERLHPSILVHRELYYPSPGPGVAQWLRPAYADTGLARAEILTTSSSSDAYVGWEIRHSPDNGRTWSAPQPIEGVVQDTPAGGIVTYPAAAHFDPASGRGHRFFMVRQWPGLPCYSYNWGGGEHAHPCVDHVFVSEDDGPPMLLRYEDGADYDPENPFDPAYLQANRGYYGSAPTFGDDGTVYFPISGAGESQDGVVLFRRDPADGQWHPSNCRSISPELSSRGLLEPEAALLEDGRILIICRGSDTPTTPGRKWRIISEDGGRTLGPVEELRYDDGSRFYSPSSIHHFVRSRRNGLLYWLANIVPEPPHGNSPRYPLYITELDEQRAAVRKPSLIMLDTRWPGEPEKLQLSNFGVLQDRETDNVEIYITLFGLDAEDRWHAGVHRYVFSPPGG